MKFGVSSCFSSVGGSIDTLSDEPRFHGELCEIFSGFLESYAYSNMMAKEKTFSLIMLSQLLNIEIKVKTISVILS